MVYATEVIVKKIKKYVVEYRDKEYDKEDVIIEHYQYEELYEEKNGDSLTLYVKSSDINLMLKTTSFGCLERIIKSSYPLILDDKRADYSLFYKKICVNTMICTFNGYSSKHYEDCISLREQLEIIKNDISLNPYWDHAPKEVPILEKYKNEIYNFLSNN